MSSSPLLARIEKVKKALKEHDVPGILIQDSVNLLYYTGVRISTGILYIGQDSEALIVDFRYSERCKKLSPVKVIATQKQKEGLSQLNLPKKVAIDSHCVLVKDQELYSQLTTLVSLPQFLSKLRMIKDAHEIKMIKKSCQITKDGMAYISKQLKEGVTEQEIAYKLEAHLKKLGAQKMSFDPIIAFGKNSANPHYTPQKVKLKKNDVALVDCGSIYENYCSDMTRTFICGKVSAKMEEIIELTLKAQKAAVKICKPGVTIQELNHKVRSIYEEHGVLDLFIHNLGHGVGIEIHEYPSLALGQEMALQEGMVITIEPGLYIPNLGGVRMEDTILITKTGYQNLTG